MLDIGDLLVVQTVKNLPAMQETCVRSLGWEDPLEERAWPPTPVFLPGEPMETGAWWATVHGVAESRTQLKQLSTVPSHLIVRPTFSLNSCSSGGKKSLPDLFPDGTFLSFI